MLPTLNWTWIVRRFNVLSRGGRTYQGSQKVICLRCAWRDAHSFADRYPYPDPGEGRGRAAHRWLTASRLGGGLGGLLVIIKGIGVLLRIAKG